jgi:hypothetical protein
MLCGRLLLPADVAEYHIFSYLSIASLTSCSMVCQSWKKIISRSQQRGSAGQMKKGSAETRQQLCHKCLFSEGASIEFLQWFQRRLGYPSHPSLALIVLAAKGIIQLDK